MTTTAQRQAEFKKRMKDGGFVQVSAWVHAHQAADVSNALKLLKEDADLEIGPLRNVVTGRLRKSR
jgi:hypothetical protein